MNLIALRAELDNDPLTRGYSGMGDEAAANSLNAVTRTCYEPISSAELLAWSGNGATDGSVPCRYERIQEAAATNASHSVRGAAIAALGMIERPDTSLDLNKPDRMLLLDALVAGGVLTAGEKTELLTMATVACSRAAELGLGNVTPSNVADARRL